MDISFDATTRLSNIGTPGTSVSGSHSVTPNDGNSVVLVFVTWNAGSISVTYGGVQMTFSGLQTSSPSMALFILRNPPTGSQTVVATTTLSSTTVVDIISYKSVSIYGSLGLTNTTSANTGGSSTATSVTPTTDRCWMVAYGRSTGTLSLGGSGFTARTNANNIILADSNAAVARNVQQTFTTTYTPSGGTNSHIVVSLRPAVAGGGMIGLM